jgi:hypothetical protein
MSIAKRKPATVILLSITAIMTATLFQNCAGQNLTAGDIDEQIKLADSSKSISNQTSAEDSQSVNSQVVCTYYWYAGGFTNGPIGPDNAVECSAGNLGAIAFNKDHGYRYTCIVSPSRCAATGASATQTVTVPARSF